MLSPTELITRKNFVFSSLKFKKSYLFYLNFFIKPQIIFETSIIKLYKSIKFFSSKYSNCFQKSNIDLTSQHEPFDTYKNWINSLLDFLSNHSAILFDTEIQTLWIWSLIFQNTLYILIHKLNDFFQQIKSSNFSTHILIIITLYF
jgi:hypothetical protein